MDGGLRNHHAYLCRQNCIFSYITIGDADEILYIGDTRMAWVLNDMLLVVNIRANLVSMALLDIVMVNVSFEFNKIVMINNNVFVFVGNGYRNQELFILNVSNNNNTSTFSTYVIDSLNI